MRKENDVADRSDTEDSKPSSRICYQVTSHNKSYYNSPNPGGTEEMHEQGLLT